MVLMPKKKKKEEELEEIDEAVEEDLDEEEDEEEVKKSKEPEVSPFKVEPIGQIVGFSLKVDGETIKFYGENAEGLAKAFKKIFELAQ